MEKSGLLVVEPRKAMVRAKTFIEEFKSSSDFLEAVEDTASKYFGEGFDFIKRQFCCHHPDLAIDIEDMCLDHDLLAEEADGEEKEKEEGNVDNEENDRGDTNPPPP